MNRHRMIVLGLGLVLLGMVAAAPSSRPRDPAADQLRLEFVKDFNRGPLNVAPDDGVLLRLLIQGTNAQRALEVGSANGYSAIHMGIALERTGGHLTTIDIDPQMVKQCRDNLAKARLEQTVTVVEGDALKVLPELKGEFDFLFMDAVKSDNLKYFNAVKSKLKAGSLVVAHNAIMSAGEMRPFLEAIKNDPDYEMVIVRAGAAGRDGMAVCVKKP